MHIYKFVFFYYKVIVIYSVDLFLSVMLNIMCTSNLLLFLESSFVLFEFFLIVFYPSSAVGTFLSLTM